MDDVIRHGAARLDFKYAFLLHLCSPAACVSTCWMTAGKSTTRASRLLAPVYPLGYQQKHATRDKKKAIVLGACHRRTEERGSRHAYRSMDSILSHAENHRLTDTTIAIIPAPCHQTQSGRARGERRWRRFLKTSGGWPNVALRT